MINISTEGESTKYSKFIIESITTVFSSPTTKIFDGEQKEKGLTPKSSEQFVKIIEPILKALEKQS